MDKKCSLCKGIKPIGDFNKKSRTSDGLQNICRDCNKKKSRDYYSKNKEKQKKQIHEAKKKRIKLNRERMLAYLKQNSCVKCGFDHPAALDFDHLRDKRRNVSNLLCEGFSWKRIEEEIKNCQVLCANCHRIKTANDYNWYKRQ
jgi:5-methylcytosine-specific restriction endonuclease McrA